MSTDLSPHDLAERIARDIMELGDEPHSPAHRIEFKGGSVYLERSQGGLCEKSLATFIKKSLEKHFSQ